MWGVGPGMTAVERQAGSSRKAGRKGSSWSNGLQATTPITGATRHRSQLPCFWQWPYEGKRTDASAPLLAEPSNQWVRSHGHCLYDRTFRSTFDFKRCAAAQGPAKDNLPKPKTLSAITTAVPSSDQLLSGGSTSSLHLARTIPPV